MFFLDNLIDKTKSNIEIIVDILQARGFLIDKKDERYFLSDNASISDAEYLSKIIRKYELGIMHDKKEYDLRSRRCWDEGALFRSYQYYALKPYKVEIEICENADIENVKNLFADMGRNGLEAGPTIRKWRQFAIEVLSPKVGVRKAIYSKI